MILDIAPKLQDETYVFCSTTDPGTAAICAEQAVGMFVEAEGDSFIILAEEAYKLGLDCGLLMRMITLTTHSALDGVGLTAAVAAKLAAVGIPCNMVAAYHHDHVFIPAARADEAFRALAEM